MKTYRTNKGLCRAAEKSNDYLMEEKKMQKPIIGITSNFTSNDEVGKLANLGGAHQQWQLIADDYISAIESAGGVPVILPVVENAENLLPVLSVLDGLVVSGGNDVNPLLYDEVPISSLGEVSIKRDNSEFNLLTKALKDFDMPIIGICRGCQLLNVVKGGTLHQDLVAAKVTEREHFQLAYPKNYGWQKAIVKEDSKLYHMLRETEIKINSFHHQGINKVGENLIVTARGEDGVVEAIESIEDRFVMGLQWHPEMMSSENKSFFKLFEAFVKECSK